MKSILLINHSHGFFNMRLPEEAKGRNIKPVIITPKEIIQKSSVSLYLGSGSNTGILRSGKKIFNEKNFIAVFPGQMFLGNSRYQKGKDYIYKLNEWNAFYRGWLRSLKIPVINPVSHLTWSRTEYYPPDFLPFVNKSILQIPEFIVSNCFNKLKEFYYKHNQSVRLIPGTAGSAQYLINCKPKLMKLEALSKIMTITLTEIPDESDLSIKIFVTGNESISTDKSGELMNSIPQSIADSCKLISKKSGAVFVQFDITQSRKNFCLTKFSLNPDLSSLSCEAVSKIFENIFRIIKE